MKKAAYCLYIFFGAFGFFLLFLLNFLYIFVALGLLSLGLIAFPSSLLGAAGIINIVTDLSGMSLMLISGGALLTGLGMCLCAAGLCSGSLGLFRRFLKRAGFKRQALYE